jgi:hypothetical protein
MFTMFARCRRRMLLTAGAVLLIAMSAAGAGSAAALRGTSGHASTAKHGLKRDLAIFPAPRITYKPIDFPGANGTYPMGIARTGLLGQVTKVVGWYHDTHGAHGFVMSLGQYTTLDYPGASFTNANGINRRGQIVGTYGIPGTRRQCGFIYDARTPGSPRTPWWAYSTIPRSCSGRRGGLEPHGINNAGDIVGDYPSVGARAGFLSVNGIVESGIKFPGSRSTTLLGLNNNAVPEVVGFYSEANGEDHGMAFTGSNASAARSIDVPGAGQTIASGVNDSGQIVGEHITQTGTYGFVDDGGRFTTIDYPGASFTTASAIDDPASVDHSYDVVGSSDHGGFIATVTPVVVAKGPPITANTRRK